MAERSPLRPNFFNVSFGSGETKTFRFPTQQYRTLSLYIHARDSGGGDDMDADVQLKINGFFAQHPVAKDGVVKMNELFIFTNEDVHGEMQLTLTAGATPPSDGVDIELWGWRS